MAGGRTGRNARGARGARTTAAKIVVTGPFSAGKTTFIRTISEITILSTERDITDETASRKSETTVAMDYGRISVDRELVLYLFGTPGQERFEFMWEILGEGMIGYVLLVDGTEDSSLGDAAVILESFRASAPGTPFVVAVNRVDVVDPEREAAVRDALGLEDTVPVVGCSALERESVRDVVLALLHAVLEDIDAIAGRKLDDPSDEQTPAADEVPEPVGG